MSPSRTYMASGSTLIRGNARDSSPVCRQWVVARRPSSSPACAKMKAPVQIDVILRVRWCNAFTVATSCGSMGRPISSSLPETTTVSAASTASIGVDTASPAPTEVATS